MKKLAWKIQGFECRGSLELLKSKVQNYLQFGSQQGGWKRFTKKAPALTGWITVSKGILRVSRELKKNGKKDWPVKKVVSWMSGSIKAKWELPGIRLTWTLKRKLKQAARSSLGIEIKWEQEKKGDETGMLYELRIWQGFGSQCITQKSE